MDAVGELDLRGARVNERGTGDEQYPPRLLLGLLIYSYATGVFASRQIERATYDSVAVRLLCADTAPRPKPDAPATSYGSKPSNRCSGSSKRPEPHRSAILSRLMPHPRGVSDGNQSRASRKAPAPPTTRPRFFNHPLPQTPTGCWHFLLETPEANLVAGMRWFQTTWTMRFNARHRLSGHFSKAGITADTGETPVKKSEFQETPPFSH